MKFTICALFASVAPLLDAVDTLRAQTYTQQRLGGMTFTTGSNGYHAMEQRLGGMTFGSDSNGSWMTQDLGNTRTTTYTPFGLGDPDKD